MTIPIGNNELMRFSHGFNQWQVGLTFLGIFVGMVSFNFVEIVTLL
jgi:hypothetical protein